MRKTNLFLVPFILFSLLACNDKEDNSSNPDLIPTGITESGVLGSWAHNGTDLPANVLSANIYIENNETTFANICNFGDHTVTAAIRVSSDLEANVLTLLGGDSYTVTEGSLTCTVSAANNSFFALSNVTQNQLNVTRNGATVLYSRINPITTPDQDDDDEDN